MRSVADFLAAGRSAGRYLLSVSQGVSGLGAITIVGLLEMNYVAGFSDDLVGADDGRGGAAHHRLGLGDLPLPPDAAASPWRSSSSAATAGSFRIFAGSIAFVSGIVNFGIFPAVEARFFIYFCGLPQAVPFLGLPLPTFPLMMCPALPSLSFVFAGGQVAVIVADFLQGIFVNVVFVAVMLFLLSRSTGGRSPRPWPRRRQNASLDQSVPDQPGGRLQSGYFLIGIVGVFYGTMSWQGTQAYNASALNAHEAKMAAVLGNWRILPQNLMLLIVPIMAYTVLHHPDFAGAAAGRARHAGRRSPNEAIQSQLRTPLVLTHLLPPG